MYEDEKFMARRALTDPVLTAKVLDPAERGGPRPEQSRFAEGRFTDENASRFDCNERRLAGADRMDL